MAFSGICIMQNPFQSQSYTNNTFAFESIGALMSLLGAVTMGITSVLIKKMGKEVHFLMSPLSWAIANLIFCPIFNGL